MSTTFHVPENGASSTVAVGRSPAGASLVLVDGSTFGTVFPKIVTISRAGAVLCILEATARVSNTLTVGSALEGTSDVSMVIGDLVELRPTKLAMTEIHDAIHNLETIVEVSVTSVTTLTSSAIGKMHAVSGGSTFNLTFPTAVGISGSTIAVRCAAGYTGLVTLLGNSGQTFAGIAGLVMHAGESAVWESDNSNWVRVGGTGPIPMVCQIRLGSSNQTISVTTLTLVTLDQTDQDPSGLMADLANHRIAIARPGVYWCQGVTSWFGLAHNTSRVRMQLHKNGSQVIGGEQAAMTSTYPDVQGSAFLTLAAGDLLTLNAYYDDLTGTGTNAVNAAATADACLLSVQEIPAW